MKYTFRRLINIFDNQLKQVPRSNVVSVEDNARLATQNQLAIWTNFQLNHLSTINPLFWRKVQEYTVANDSEILEFPYYWRHIDHIVKNGVKYPIGVETDPAAYYVVIDDYRIRMRSGQFTAGEEIKIVGSFMPDQLKEDCADETEREAALNSFVDMPISYINLLVYGVVLDYAGREGEMYQQLFYTYRQLLKRFENDSPTVNTVGAYETPMPFGEYPR